MKTLEKAIAAINSMGISASRSCIDPRLRLVVTVVYIATVLSVPMLDPGRLVWLFVFPIITSEAAGIGYGKVFLRSLYVVPLIVAIGIFNPILDKEPCWIIGNTVVSQGWVSLISIVLRGLLSLQALLVLVMSMGFYDVIKALDRLGCPAVLTTQLMMLYRYTGVLLQEALVMHRAREARGFGKKSYPLRLWGTFIGQLLIRSVHRAKRVDSAMVARGFKGTFHWQHISSAPSAKSWLWLFAWCAIFASLRLFDLTSLLNSFLAG